MDEKVACRRWSRGGGVAARATRSSASLFMRVRNLRVCARTDFIGAAHPRAVRTGDRVSRRPARIRSTSDPPNGYKDTTRERHDVRQIAPLSFFFGVFMFSRRTPRSPRGTRRERGALASTTAEGTRDTRVDLARVHPGGGREAATRYDEPTRPPRRATAPDVVTTETGVSRDASRATVRARRRAPLGWRRGRRYVPQDEKTCRRAGAFLRGR